MNREDVIDDTAAEKPVLYVRTFGDFTIQYQDAVLRESMSKSYTIRTLLAYLCFHHRRKIPDAEIISMLEASKNKPVNGQTFRMTLLRARRTLEQLGPVGTAPLLWHKRGFCGWNPEVTVKLDADIFEKLCRRAETAEPDAANQAAKQAVALYQGDFLAKYQTELWVGQTIPYYQNKLLNVTLNACSRMTAPEEAGEAVRLCRSVLRFEPYNEPLHQELLRRLLMTGEYREAVNTYEAFRQTLRTDLGVVPEPETQALYQEAFYRINNQTLTPEDIRAKLEAEDTTPGALLCDLDTFRKYCHAEVRSAERRGENFHIAVLTLTGKGGVPLSNRSARYAMEKLRPVLVSSLRSGDIAARCSERQYLVMLIQANYENSEKVCARISRAFSAACPQSPALIQTVLISMNEEREAAAGKKSASALIFDTKKTEV